MSVHFDSREPIWQWKGDLRDELFGGFSTIQWR